MMLDDEVKNRTTQKNKRIRITGTPGIWTPIESMSAMNEEA
jgi:hypothetical protein